MFRKIFILITVLGLTFQADFCLAANLVPNDPYLNKQWYLNNMQMSSIWSQQTGDSSVIVAVIDSGVYIDHPDLHDNIWVNQKEIGGDGIDNDHNGYTDDINGWDFIDNDADPRPKYDNACLDNATCIQEAIYHGTVISGVIAAIGNNNVGIAGLTWKTKIMPLRVLDQNGNGSTADVVNAIDYAIKNKADIINLSFISLYFDQALADAIQRAYTAGLVIISSAGNEENVWEYSPSLNQYVQVSVPVNLDVDKRYPICYFNSVGEKMVIGVAASDEANRLATFSNYGSSCVDVVAPGQDIFGSLVYNASVPKLSNYYGGYFSGTSLAAPMVTGVIALIKASKPELTNKQIRDLVLNNTTNIDSLNAAMAGKLGHGEINPVKIFQNFNLTIVSSGKLIKGSTSSLYYLGADNKRYVFPDQKTFFSWYDNFNGVSVISDSELAGYALGGVVTMRPGSLIKIATDPHVYAVSKGAVLHWVTSETLVSSLYGANWSAQITDVSDSLFINYKIGDDLVTGTTFNPLIEKLGVVSIDQNMGL